MLQLYGTITNCYITPCLDIDIGNKWCVIMNPARSLFALPLYPSAPRIPEAGLTLHYIHETKHRGPVQMYRHRYLSDHACANIATWSSRIALSTELSKHGRPVSSVPSWAICRIHQRDILAGRIKDVLVKLPRNVECSCTFMRFALNDLQRFGGRESCAFAKNIRQMH